MKNLKDIAKELGVSVSTVSRVVNNKSVVNETTRKLVLDALKKYDYSPNLIARSLKSKSSRTVGIVVPDITESLFGTVIKAVCAKAEAHGYGVLVCDTDENIDREERYLRYLFEKQIDGIILASVSRSNENHEINKYMNNNIPVVLIDNDLFTNTNGVDKVFVDNFEAGEIGTSYLLEVTGGNVGFICGRIEEYTGYSRLEGYINAYKKKAITPDMSCVYYGDYKEKSGYNAVYELLQLHPDLKSIFVTSSKMTYGAIKALREKNLFYPRDIRIIGFDVNDAYDCFMPGITSVVQPEYEIGTTAVELLLKRIADPGSTRENIILKPKLLVKESV
ncbi:MAG: LacI family transcriptional regulator [Oscillospiraceae bacterium]|nr:LacI family transcriptional regulator [Oscillospiraceae bacterium]